MGAWLSHAYRQCDDDAAVRAIMLTGAGDDFCVGADFSTDARPFDVPSGDVAASPTNPAAFELRTPVSAAAQRTRH
jgi:enoyl-CoA hydratase/carnithine racemase